MDDRKKNIVEKRRNTILKKRENKMLSKSKNQEKNILKAGLAFSTENDNISDRFKLKVNSSERARKKYEKVLDKQAINGMFQLRTIDDVENLNIEKKGIIQPNYDYIKSRIRNIFTREVTNNSKNLKILQSVTIKYDIYNVGESTREGYFNSDTTALPSTKVIEDILDKIVGDFEKSIDGVNQRGSGKFDGIIKIDVKLSKSKNIYGGSFVELPQDIKAKKACVNIVNKDDKCFLWSLLASQHYDTIKKVEVRYYKKFDSVIIPENATFPVSVDDIEMWELANNMKINVFALDDKEKIYCEYNRQFRNKNVVNLLLYKNHYVWLKNFDRFDYSNTSDHSKYRCMQCIEYCFPTQQKLENHLKKCLTGSTLVDEELPTKGKDDIMKFRNNCNKFKHPFHVVADFESTLEEVYDVNTTNTTKYQHHVANSYGLKYNCIHDEYSKPVKIFNSSKPEEVIKSFVQELESLALYSYELTQKNKSTAKIIINNEQIINHKLCNHCEECKTEFSIDNVKVRHHDHINGDFISSICYNCNIELQYKKFMPVYIHNLKGYDSHLFISGLFKYGYQKEKIDNISCIPNNEERYISFSKNIKVGEYNFFDEETAKYIKKPIMYEIRFIDTFAFMASSIDSLAENLKKGCNYTSDLRKKFKNTSNHFKNDDQFLLMIEKGVYPYDYINNYERLNETRLPYRKDFSNKSKTGKIGDMLIDHECSIEDYDKAINVWKTFKCKTMLDYHNIYLHSDVLLLTDIWENFRSICYRDYKLDPEYYYTAPSLSFDAMLKMTKVELELITDLEIYNFIESGIRGGISQISTRHAIANNKYMKNYEKSKEESSIIYLDANNLYGHAMCQHLPYKNFKWNTEEWKTEDIMKLGDKDDKGYTFEVDITLPDHLHDHFNNYPLFPENMPIKKTELNSWQQKDYKQSTISKLCLTFHDKEKYVVNYRYLKLALSLGYVLKKVHRVLEYSQIDFLEKYIMLNTELRKIATKNKNKFEEDFYKLMNNSVYGKTMENVRNRINFRLISTDDEALRVKNMKRFTIFNENLVGLHIQKQKVKLCKPIYLGQCILDDSKVLMSSFHYNFMLNEDITGIKREDIDLLFTDTDSLCYHIRKNDIFEIMKKYEDEFDLSNYPKEHYLYNDINNKALGKFKNESITQITEFIGLRSKLYSFTVDGENDSHNKCKGVKTYVAKKLSIDNYRNTLETNESLSVKQNSIRSYQHELYTESTTKVALSSVDDKVYIENCYIKTINFGHYKIRKNI